jgi:hypothetical protein
LKTQKLTLKYEYWDGIHKETSIDLKLGQTVTDFMKACLIDLGKTYKHLEGAPVEGFLFVKGEYVVQINSLNAQGLITTFMDLYSSSKNKTNPITEQLFTFSENADGSFTDTSNLKVKIVEKQMYEKQKHIFPFNQWKVFDPNHK